MRAVELLSFAALASGLHLGAWVLISDGGSAAPGGGGEQAMTVAAAPEHLAALAEHWETSPDVAAEIAPMRAPTPATDVALPVPALADAPIAKPSHMSTPTADAMPQVAERAPLTASAPQITPPSLPRLQTAALPVPAYNPDSAHRAAPNDTALHRPETPQSPQVDTSTDAPKGELLRSKRPKAAAQRPAQDAPKAPTRAKPSQSAKAKGNGTLKTAGNTHAGTNKPPAAAQPGNDAKLTRIWGQAITSKIQANAVRPTGNASQAANVKLRVTVSKSGKLLGYGVARSSGLAAFDKASLRAVKRARRFAKAPAGLNRPSYTFAVTVGFR